jgi:hypothetical protein
MGLFSRSRKVAPAPGPVIAALSADTVKKLNDAGQAETAAFMAKYPAALDMEEPGRLNGLLEYAKEIKTASEDGTVVALQIRTSKKTVVLPKSKASLFSKTGSGLNVQGGRTQRNRRNRVGRKTRKLTTRRR